MSNPVKSTGAPAKMITPNDCAVPFPGNDGISSLHWSPVANILVSTNWDGSVSAWEVKQQADEKVEALPKAQVFHADKKPVLDACFSSDGSIIFSGGVDNAVRMWRLNDAVPDNGVAAQIGRHDAAVKAVGFLNASNLVVSGSWDQTLKFWDGRTPHPVHTIQLPGKVFAMDVKGDLLVVGTSTRQIIIIDVSTAQPRELTRMESPLKYQIKCIACFPDSKGFAIGNIAGTVKIHSLHENPVKTQFSLDQTNENKYAVNVIAFQHNTVFATACSEGVVRIYNKEYWQRKKVYPEVERTISAAAFNSTGTLFAYASSYDWSKGCQHIQPGNEIFIHSVTTEEDKLFRKKREKKPQNKK